MSLAIRGFAILYWLPWWIVDKWCGEKLCCAMMCLYILPCTLYILQYTQLYIAYTSLTWYLPRPTRNIVLVAQALTSLSPQPSQTKQDRVYAGPCTRFDRARRRSIMILSNVVGVRIPDGSPGHAMAAHKAGWVDWGKPAGWVGVSRQSWWAVWTRLLLDSSRAPSYPASTCCGRSLDILWVCRMGVWAVQGYKTCQMLSMDMPKSRFASHFTISHASIYTDRHSISQYIHRDTWYVIVCMSTYWDILYFCVQDTILVVPPYPYCIEEDRHNDRMEDCWSARPQLFFTCVLRPKNGRLPKTRT